MTKQSKCIVISVLLVTFVVIGAGYTYSAINQRIYDTIKVAYLNGYVDALKLDIKKIERLKSDDGEMRTTVMEEAEAYVAKVMELNNESPQDTK